MKMHLESRRLVVVNREGEPTSSEGILPDGFLPVVILLAIAMIRLGAFAWHPASWGAEESLALAFALVAALLFVQSVPRRTNRSPRSR
jgi:membrane protein implicated in regulation of membrane protease activity